MTLELRILPDIRGAVRVARWQSCSSHRYRVSPCLQWALLEPFPIRRLWADQNRLRFGGQQPAQRLGTVDCNGRPMVRGADVHSRSSAQVTNRPRGREVAFGHEKKGRSNCKRPWTILSLGA